MPETLRIGPWPKGLNLADPMGSLEDDELSLCQNCRLDPRGNPYKRPGHGGYGSSQNKINGDNSVNLLARFYKSDGSKALIGAAGGKLKKGNDSTGAWTDIDIDGVPANTMNSTNLVDFIVYKDRIYLADGTRPQRYDGTNDLYAGHFTPNSAGWTLTPGAGGSLTPSSTYQYKMTVVQGDLGEGPASAARSVALGGAQNRVTLGSLDSAPGVYGATAKKLYRTKAGGSVFYFLVELAAGAASYVDDIADSNLLTEIINVHAPRADSRFVILGHDERSYWFGRTGVNASIVEPSDIGFPDRILDTEFFAVSNNDGDVLTGAGKVPGGLVFFKRNSMWLLRAFGYGLINISSKVGTVAPFSVVEVPGGIIFLSQQKRFYYFDGTNLKEIGRKVAPELQGITETALNQVVAAYHDDRYILAYDYRGLKGYNNRVLEFDLVGGKWEGPHSNGTLLTPSYFSAWDSQLDRGELYWGEDRAAAGSFVYGRTEFTLKDNGSNFQTKWRTGKLVITNLQEKKIYKAFVDGRWDGTLVLKVSGEDTSKDTTVDLSNAVPSNALIWGSGNWGEKVWGGPIQQVAEGPVGPGARQRRPIFEFDDKGSCTVLFEERVDVLVDPVLLK